MKYLAVLVLTFLASSSALATITNTAVTINGSSGPFTFAPSEPLTVMVTADVNNVGTAPTTWGSTRIELLDDGPPVGVCSENPAPNVAPPVAGTLPGTATVTGLTAPSTPGTYRILPVLYGADGCLNTAGNSPILVIPITVAAASSTTATAVPTLPAYGLAITGLGLLILAGRRLRVSTSN